MEEKELENFALNIMLANPLRCHSIDNEKLECCLFSFHQTQSKNATCSQTEEKLLPKS